MQAKSIELRLYEDLYVKIGAATSEHFETAQGAIQNVFSDSAREELELKDVKRQIASGSAEDNISYESLGPLLGYK